MLYRYFGSHALETLRDAQLMVACPNDFNDPFECMYVVVGEMTPDKAQAFLRTRVSDPAFLDEFIREDPRIQSREQAQSVVRRDWNRLRTVLMNKYDSIKAATERQREDLVAQFTRVVCFSADDAKPKDEILMWSHYGNAHRGVRIGFEFPLQPGSFKVHKVTYQENRVEVDMSGDTFSPDIQDALRRSMTTKSTAWAYEREHRAMTVPQMCRKRQCPDDKTREFLDFKCNWVRRIDFGTRIDPQVKADILALAKRDYPHAERREATYHKAAYSLEYKPL